VKALFIIALAALFAAFIFWEVFSAILGGVAIMALILVMLLVVAAYTGYRAFGELRDQLKDRLG